MEGKRYFNDVTRLQFPFVPNPNLDTEDETKRKKREGWEIKKKGKDERKRGREKGRENGLRCP